VIVADGALAGRTAAVTGASSGIGLAAARRLRELGAAVTALSRRRETMQEALGDGFDLRALDVTDGEAARRALDHPELDVLVLAAGTNVTNRRLEQLSAEDWRELVDTNLTGVYNLVAAALPALRAARGIAIIVGSVSGLGPDRSGPGYQATKAGVLALARGAALEEHERGTGVRFSVVAPGMVDTPLIDRRPEPPPPETREQMLSAAEVAETCAFLAALPPSMLVPELTVLPTALQAPGATS
jgi:NADP-dependent 3-hydroxy acid dehydrogenase YdfG